MYVSERISIPFSLFYDLILIFLNGQFINQLCGRSENFTINVLSAAQNDVAITFHSDELDEGKGFEFVVQRSDGMNK